MLTHTIIQPPSHRLLMNFFRKIVAAAILPVALNAAPIDLQVDVQNKTYPVNEMVYGQFIEHMGRCIYGGIWAEMLEDRKFYWEITENYAPYKAFLDSPNPAVGSSPWKITGNPSGVVMIKEDSFVGDQTPLIKKGSGIQQLDLAVVEDKTYEGYIWLKAGTEKGATVDVSMLVDGEKVMSEEFVVGNRKYEKFDFFWSNQTPSDHAVLDIRVISGDCLVGTVSLMPGDNVNGMRADTLTLLKELNSPVYRWPGGNFVSGYDWRDGIGDRDRRPPRKNEAWVGIEHNDFGTDEFIAFCREINTQPMVAVNTGFGDAYSAAQWVEYCNAAADTIGGSWRKENGNETPYGVRYWCVGNEMWGTWQMGFMHLDQYVIKHNMVAKAMWEIDDSLVLVASGDFDAQSKSLSNNLENKGNRVRGWSEGLLEESADYMNMISEHFYCGRLPWNDQPRLDLLSHVAQIKTMIKKKADQHRELQAAMPSLKGKRIPIALDEWNYWHRDAVYGELGCVYDLADALGIAAGIHELYRQADIIPLATYAQTVNVIGCIKTSKTDAEFATTGLVLSLYRDKFGLVPLAVENNHDPLDISAALDDNGKVLTVSVVNPLEKDIPIDLSVLNATLVENGEIYWITGAAETAHNAPGQPRQVDIYHKDGLSPSSSLTVPKLSCAIFRFSLE
ncbi:MAG: alpha-N-arabinofuranosidase [Opitutales bacterium]|nr:alpha-N-arabinofuranosidase [Opitutales bacterium]